ncbi:MAG TPA: flagellar hook-length control protein FliK [Solirubrobacteraceae bacterium]
MRLAEAAEQVATTISMGARNGVSVARIQLAPESLGAIAIHLQRTSDGIVARVITEHPETADTLSQGGDDLRRQLQQNGTHLVRLDIESSGQQRSSTQEQTGTAPGSARSRGDDGEEDSGADPVAAVANDIPIQSLSGSALVNVLA